MSALKSRSNRSTVEARHEGNVDAFGALKTSALSFGSRFGATSLSSSEQITYNTKSGSILPPKSEVAIASQWEESLSASLIKRMKYYNLSRNLMYKKLIRDNLEAMIDWMQQQERKEPLDRETWRLIILNEYVNFKKLYATLDSDYPYEKRPISARNEWERVFCVWEKAVTAIYPHRRDELCLYRLMMIEAFQACQNDDLVPIRLDAMTRLGYPSCSPPDRLDAHQQRWDRLLSRMKTIIVIERSLKESNECDDDVELVLCCGFCPEYHSYFDGEKLYVNWMGKIIKNI